MKCIKAKFLLSLLTLLMPSASHSETNVPKIEMSDHGISAMDAERKLLVRGEISQLHLTIRITDELNEPVENAMAIVHFDSLDENQNAKNMKYEAVSNNLKPLEFQSPGFGTYTIISHKQFWETSFNDEWPESIDEKTGWYRPVTRKSIDLQLRRKINPRPLFVQRVDNLPLPGVNGRFGFDMETGDFVKPHGKGKREDLIFSVEGWQNDDTNEHEVTLKLLLPNSDDGFIPVERKMIGSSQLLLGQSAPLDGYVSKLLFVDRSVIKDGILQTERTPSRTEIESWEGIWFRTHSQTNEKTGEVTTARYGKIYYSLDRIFVFEVQTSSKPKSVVLPRVSFIYFYTPDNSRSVEFNGKTLVPGGDVNGVDKK